MVEEIGDRLSLTIMYHLFIYQPIFNALVFIYNNIAFGDFGLSVVFLTLLMRFVLFPLTLKSTKANIKLQEVQPKIREIQEKYKDDKTGLATATMAVYAEHKINPLSGCLPILIQLPILIGLYSAFSSVFKPDALKDVYSFIHNPQTINSISLGFIDLTKSSLPLAVLAGVLQFVQVKFSLGQQKNISSDDPSQAMSRQMMYIFPIMLVLIAYKLPIGIVIYFISSSVFATIEQWVVKRFFINR